MLKTSRNSGNNSLVASQCTVFDSGYFTIAEIKFKLHKIKNVRNSIIEQKISLGLISNFLKVATSKNSKNLLTVVSSGDFFQRGDKSTI